MTYAASGTGAWEAALVNTLQPGDKVLMAETGQFAVLWRGIADYILYHDIGVMFAGEDIAGPAHIGSELVNLVKAPIVNRPDHVLFAQIADHEFIRRACAEFGVLEIDPADEKALMLESLDQMTSDKSASAENQGSLHA